MYYGWIYYGGGRSKSNISGPKNWVSSFHPTVQHLNFPIQKTLTRLMTHFEHTNSLKIQKVFTHFQVLAPGNCCSHLRAGPSHSKPRVSHGHVKPLSMIWQMGTSHYQVQDKYCKSSEELNEEKLIAPWPSTTASLVERSATPCERRALREASAFGLRMCELEFEKAMLRHVAWLLEWMICHQVLGPLIRLRNECNDSSH